MMRSFRNLIERQIKKAEAEGQLADLEGAGKPLPPRHALEDPAIAAGHRIMAQAGVVPREFELKEQLEQARKDWRSATDPADRKRLMARIAELELAYNVEREAYRKFLK
ncbi:DUF1992 domain-containing protein [Shimia aestuarii]|uniref:DnaJ homologue subfamily C member 28 conserved domain-containing protein n=1 Tax=Shimia aestuarii TaxID=254406 RepID=A0A1I4IMT5_9RHOB|nr:DUF1992 domain-containing protein [Shimia aestuarii]SFL55111.1 protein of unknown function [Shimia aestuarii]